MKTPLRFARRILLIIAAFLAGCAGSVRYQDRDKTLTVDLKRADAAVDLME